MSQPHRPHKWKSLEQRPKIILFMSVALMVLSGISSFLIIASIHYLLLKQGFDWNDVIIISIIIALVTTIPLSYGLYKKRKIAWSTTVGSSIILSSLLFIIYLSTILDNAGDSPGIGVIYTISAYFIPPIAFYILIIYLMRKPRNKTYFDY
jgi:hypothetical protein